MLALKICALFLVMWQPEIPKIDAINVPIDNSDITNSNCIKEFLDKVMLVFDKLNWTCNRKSIHEIIKDIISKLREETKETKVTKRTNVMDEIQRGAEASQPNIHSCLLEILKANSKLNKAPVDISPVQAVKERSTHWDPESYNSHKYRSHLKKEKVNVGQRRFLDNEGDLDEGYAEEVVFPATLNRIYDDNIMLDKDKDQ